MYLASQLLHQISLIIKCCNKKTDNEGKGTSSYVGAYLKIYPPDQVRYSNPTEVWQQTRFFWLLSSIYKILIRVLIDPSSKTWIQDKSSSALQTLAVTYNKTDCSLLLYALFTKSNHSKGISRSSFIISAGTL